MACSWQLNLSSVKIPTTPHLERGSSWKRSENYRDHTCLIKVGLTGVQCEKGLVHGGWQCLTVVGLFCGKHPPGGGQQVLTSVPLPTDH